MSLLIPIIIAIGVWWIGTGVVLYLQQQLRSTRLRLIVSLSVLSLLALSSITLTSSGFAHWQSYAGFISAVVLWGCLELSYYTGLITGTHKQTCPDRCSTWKRFRLALSASIWHETSVLIIGSLVVLLLFDAENPVGLYTFMVLWMMRWSAKLNLFFGVPNFNTDWFPKNMAYAHSYIRRAPVTAFFPVSILLACLVAFLWLSDSLAVDSPRALSTTLPAILLLLAILEHAFMVLPIADSALWNRIFADDDITPDNANAPSNPAHYTPQSRLEEVASGSTTDQVSVTLVPVDTSTSGPVTR